MKAVRIETSPFQVLALVEFESVLKKNQSVWAPTYREDC